MRQRRDSTARVCAYQAAGGAAAWWCVYSSALEKRSRPKADSTISRGIAPTTAFGCSPGSKKAMVGMLEIPKLPASSDSASTSTLATFREPSYSSAIRSITGATWRHGAHQEAQKSTSTGTSEFRISSSNVLVVTAKGCAILESPVL